MKKVIILLLIASIVVIATVLSKQPSNTRDWEDGYDRLSSVEFTDDDTVTISNIHDWEYSQSGVISTNYISETYDLGDLEQVWFLVEPFAAWDAVAHTYFVFDFNESTPISLSIEARREKGESYSAGKGLLRAFELYYAWGTEDDFTGRRAYKDGESIYMYPLNLSPDRRRNLFRTLAQQTNALAQDPRFYNTFSSNCTNELAKIARIANPQALPWYSLYILPGHSDHFLYDQGYIDTTVSKSALRETYYISDIVREYYETGFSMKVREKLRST